MEERTCFNCAHSDLCYIFRGVKKATIGRMNIDANDAPGRERDIHAALANACLYYAPSIKETPAPQIRTLRNP